jgi:tetratricopeptide (TPR) repeat protein
MQALTLRQSVTLFLVILLGTSLAGLSGCTKQPTKTRAQLVTDAEAHLKAGELHKALTELSQALAADPSNVQVHVDLGWVYLYLGEVEKASAELQTIEKLAPKTDKAHYLRGSVYEKLGQWVDALESYNEALKTDVNNPKLHFDIANVFLQLNSPDAALREFNVALRLDPENPTYAFGKCVAYRQLKHFGRAIQACKEARVHTDDPKEKASIEEVLQTIELLESLEPVKKPS